MWKPHFLSFPPITSRLAQPARPWSAPLRPNLISNSHPSTWLGLWDCLSTCHQPSHSIWFCQPTARLVSTAPRVRFNYVLWNPTDFYIYWRYWVDICRHSRTLLCNESCPCALSGRREGYFFSASFWFLRALTTRPASLQMQSMSLSPRPFPFLPWDLEN